MFKPIGISISCLLFILNSEALNHRTSYPTFPTVELSDDSDEKVAQNVPMIITPNTTIKARQGDNVTMSCEVDIDRGSMGLLWLKGLVSLYYDKQVIIPYNRSSVETSSRGSKLTIVDVNGSDRGEYSCQVVTNHAKIKTFFSLFVAVPPEVEAYPRNGVRKVHENETIYLACKVKEEPKPTIVWKKNDDENIPRAEIEYSNLRIFYASEKDAGIYTCTVDNVHHLPVVKSFQVLVYSKPVIRMTDEIIYAKLGDKVKLVCNSGGYPKPEIKWYSLNYGLLQTLVDNNESYTIVDINDKAKFGRYKCQAINSYGEAILTVRISGSPMPPIILNPKDDYFTSTKPFELKYKVISHLPITKVIFELRNLNISGPSASVNSSEIKVNQKPNDDAVYEMKQEFEQLNTEYSYEIRVFAQNDYGISLSSKPHQISPLLHLDNSASSIILSVPIMLTTIFISMMKRIL